MLSDRLSRLASPPRRVPWSIVAAAMPGPIGLFGAVFLIFGMVFVILFAGDIRPIDELRLAASRTTATATVTGYNETNSSENDETIYIYRLTFWTPDEQEIEATSYVTGRVWSNGDRVPVRYLPDKPTVAVLENTRHSVFTPWILMCVMIFPAIGGVMFLVNALGGWRQGGCCAAAKWRMRAGSPHLRRARLSTINRCEVSL